MRKRAWLALAALMLSHVALAQDVKGSLVVRINPDAKVMSAEPLHPAFTTFVSSAAFVRWQPSAYDEKRVAGRFWTDGTQNESRQQWSYALTFCAPISLDPAAKTVPAR